MSLERCECGGGHVPDYGACPGYETGDWPEGALCIYCNHGKACHERDKDKPTYNTPLGIGFRDPRLLALHKDILASETSDLDLPWDGNE